MTEVSSTEVTSTDAPFPGAMPSKGPKRGRAQFCGDGRVYWLLLVRGAVLLMVTLGLYRFWLMTDIRRFLWSNTELAGDSFEYTGTATELLLGFLVGVAVLIPIYALIFLAATGLGIVQLASVLAFVLIGFLSPYAVYRARRYRLTRSVFRGLRFHQTGSAWRYAVCAVFWWAMIALTLGLAYPWAQAALERYKMRNTFYGNLPGRFDGSPLSLFWRGLPMWLLVLGPLFGCIALGIAVVDWSAVAQAIDLERDLTANIEGTGLGEASALVMIALGWSGFAAAMLYPAFQGLTLRWWTSGLRFGALSMTSRLRIGQVYRIYFRFLWYAFLFTLVAGVCGAVCVMLVGPYVGPQASTPAGILATCVLVIGYVIVALGFSTIHQATVKLSLWRLGVDALDLDGVAVLDRVKAQGGPSSPLGEGLADALSVGGI
ncbi:MAG: DUF898 family protein [Xanthobacteraceae bacterium]